MSAKKNPRLRPRASDLRPPIPAPRSVAIANRHAHLRVDRRAVTRVIHLLDTHASSFGGTAGGRIRRSASKRKPGVPSGELSVVFLTDTALARLHVDFLADPSVTDVIAFGAEPMPGLPAGAGPAGEICISPDAAARHVGLPHADRPHRATHRRSAFTKSPAGRRTSELQHAFSAELTLYLVHGWLHLAGYDDLVPALKRVMRRAEARAMRLLRRHNCLPRFVLTRPPCR